MPTPFFFQNGTARASTEIAFFVENSGQWDSSIRFYAKTSYGGIQFKDHSMHICFHSGDPIIVSFPTQNLQPEGSSKVESFPIYYYVNDKWLQPNMYSKLIYQDVVQGVDLLFEYSHQNVKYSLLLQPHSHIQSFYFRADNAMVYQEESIVKIKNRSGNCVQDTGLTAWKKNKKQSLPVEFILHENSYQYSIDSEYLAESIVIDPILTGTVIGGSKKETVQNIATTPFGVSWVCGSTFSPSLLHAKKQSTLSQYDAYVMQLDNSGTPLQCFIFGGSGWDEALGIDIQSNGDIVCCGGSNSSDFPVTDIITPFSPNNTNAFIFSIQVALNTTRSVILSGNNNQVAFDIVSGRNHDFFITGYTSSSDFICTNTFVNQSKESIDSNIFVTHIDLSSMQIIFSTLLGGSYWDVGFSITLDYLQNIYITGYTFSPDFPVTANAFDVIHNGNEDVFVTRLSPAGDTLIFSTYIGGESFEVGQSISCDLEGNVYIAGYTDSQNFPVTFDAMQKSLNGRQDGFIAKLSGGGVNLHACTYFGGSDWDEIIDLVTDFRGNIFVIGNTLSKDLPVTIQADCPIYKGEEDIFVSHFNYFMDTLVYSSYIGGEMSDMAGGITLDINNSVFICGSTNSSQIPNTTKDEKGKEQDILFLILNTYSHPSIQKESVLLNVQNKCGAVLVNNPMKTYSFRTLPNNFSFLEAVKNNKGPFVEGTDSKVIEYLQIVLNANPLTQLHRNSNEPGFEGIETKFFGPYSTNALRSFQSLYSLPTHGKLDFVTAKQLDKVVGTLRKSPVKLVPYQWILKPMVHDLKVQIVSPDHKQWFLEVLDPTDQTTGWINLTNISYSPSNQSSLSKEILLLHPLKDGVIGGKTESIIIDNIYKMYSAFLPDTYPTSVLLALVAHESYPSVYHFDNSLVTFDAGRGIQQITTNSYVGLGMGIALYSPTGTRYLPYWHCYQTGLSVDYPAKHNANTEKFSGYYWVEAECQPGEKYVYWGGIFRKDQCIGTCIYNCSLDTGATIYSNTPLGIKANIADGLKVVEEKYNATIGTQTSYPITFQSCYYDEPITITESDARFISAIQRYHGYFRLPQDDPNSYLYAISLQLEKIGLGIASENEKEYWFSSSLSKEKKKSFLIWSEKTRYIFTNNIPTL